MLLWNIRRALAFGLFFHLGFSTLCQIHISTNQVWQADTVRVTQNIIIDSGAKLTINSGTVVLFVEGNFIDVYGQLDIKGTAGDSVIMTAPQTSWIIVDSKKKFYGWGGVYAYENGIVNAQYTVFEKLGSLLQYKGENWAEGVLHNEGSKTMTFEHCRFNLKRDPQQSYDGCRIEGNKGMVVIKNCVFKNNIGAGNLIAVNNSATLKILNTTFSNNDIRGYMIDAVVSYQIEACRFENNKVRALLYAITFNGSSSIEQNTFTNNLGAIRLQGVYSSIYFRNNIYTNNGGQIYFWLGNNIITGNVFLGNYYADPYDFFGNDYEGIVRIENTELSGPVIVNNSFINNLSTALTMYSVLKFDIANNILHNNYPVDVDLRLDPESLNKNGRNILYNFSGQPISGTGNRSGNPRLNDAQKGFIPEANSPAIDKGTSTYSNYLLSSDVLGNPRFNGQIDIGAVESINNYVPLTDIIISDTVVARIAVGQVAARFTTTNQFPLNAIKYTLSNDNGLNNDYFQIEDDKLLLKKELTTETLLRIKVRVDHVSRAWLEEYYYLTVTPVVVRINDPPRSRVNVFPIPAQKFLMVDNVMPGMKYLVLSSSGVKIKSDFLIEEFIDISGLPDGIYILQLIFGNKIDTIKFYKHE
jgi:hypothetical protein